MSQSRPVRILPPEVARKIAAGEVIDRPNAIVRELMDNAIDSGADSITVEIYGGGIDKIRVIDNGSGMSKEDFEIAATSHATSKISTETDLLNLSTLGFRGEALCSIASVSHLEIRSGNYKLEANVTDPNKITPAQNVQGSIVQSENLFKNFPARRMFLKRPASEGKMCSNMFIEKALPFFDREFQFYADNELKINLPKEESLKDRYIAATEKSNQKDLFYTIQNRASDSSWNYTLIIGEPSVYRNDRKELSIYVNNRKINEYSLMQAIEYGCQGYFPNGTHPVACLFITIDSNLVDFNIHPAKKEVRFKDISELHHSVSLTTRNFFKDNCLKAIKPELDSSYYENTFSTEGFESPRAQSYSPHSDSMYSDIALAEPSYGSSDGPGSSGGLRRPLDSAGSDMRSRMLNSRSSMTGSRSPSADSSYAEHLANLASGDEELNSYPTSSPLQTITRSPGTVITGTEPVCHGTALGVFIILEKDNTLYLIDQHAAHERILYDLIMTGPSKPQKLLIPYEIETQSEQDDEYLESIKETLERTGFVLENMGSGKWQVTAINERWKGSALEFERLVLEQRHSPEKILDSIAAMTACKAAVKDGTYLDDKTAMELALKALELPDPHCPHGRPVWTAITKEKLFELVRRTE
ncbi:DNA mismatch repair endonuclease MutL [Treponema sp.]|uniref:DNA mismatch repair endonuclease MutL n=1 Tax=Treponema sp. TaxID=166 RepID=UPI00298EB364|nr:DNA mismatch repair endonuclease MutL [Treponema sp.]MCR5612102.1 DNA mismatch repair endonuclease MutL [Treponema sp.]